MTRTTLRLATALLLAAAAGASAAEPARTDALGDPLPPGAVLRLGTLRWRAGSPIIYLFTLPDGAVLTVCQDHTAQIWDTATGRERRRIELSTAPVNAAASPRVVT